MRLAVLILIFSTFAAVHSLVVSDNRPIYETYYKVEGEEVFFFCLDVGLSSVVQWFRIHNNSLGIIEQQQVAQLFAGTATYYDDFNTPPGRSFFTQASLTVSDVRIGDEGVFYCNTIVPSSQPMKGQKLQLVVWSIPDEPLIESLSLPTLTENITANVARCISRAGKPGADLTWYNGTQQMKVGVSNYSQVNEDSNKLTDSYSDLQIIKPTRFDHNRTFTCRVDHESYYGDTKTVDYTVLVQYKPVNVYIWVNTTTKTVYCEADSYPSPTFDWFAPGQHEYKDTQLLQMNDLFRLNGYQYFECIASNKIGKSSAKVMVDDLLYPDGKPGFAGLDYWIWGCIGGGALLIIIVIIVCCCCCRKKKPKNKKLNTKLPNKDAYSVEILGGNDRNSQPSLIEIEYHRPPTTTDSPVSNHYRSGPPSDRYPIKSAMKKSYSLERLVDEKYGPPPGTSSAHGGNNSLNRPTKEDIDNVADHIELLSKSWDNLARSREQLNRSREDLHVDLPPAPPSYRPVDENPQLPGHPFGDRGFVSMERLNDNDESQYPYMDETAEGRYFRRSQDFDHVNSNNPPSSRSSHSRPLPSTNRHSYQQQQPAAYYRHNSGSSASGGGDYHGNYRHSYRDQPPHDDHDYEGNNQRYYQQHQPTNHQDNQRYYDDNRYEADPPHHHHQQQDRHHQSHDSFESDEFDDDYNNSNEYDRNHGFLRTDVV